MYIVFHEVPYILNMYITLASLKPDMYSYTLHYRLSYLIIL